MNELNKKLAKWAGFLPIYHIFNEDYFLVSWEWPRPNGRKHVDIPDFCNSLDACFKWLVPKLALYELKSGNKNGLHFASVHYMHLEWGNSEYGETAPLALCLAIEKAIDND